ncbi:endoplasmic reticulum-resident calcium binding protein [Hepatocystis sp. ex Piliocolobus tephrosceles]|nr:endoplasmic reticulum-resident calcium binding protein [Hepatocystis sp. ex Piliocolobus tephrosceles]
MNIKTHMLYALFVIVVLFFVKYEVRGAGNEGMRYTDMRGLDDLSTFSDAQVMDVLGLNIEGTKERLSKLFHLIDKDKDNIINDEELINWGNYVKNEVFLKQVQIEMKQIDLDKDGYISLQELTDAFAQNLDAKEVEKHSEGLFKRFQIVDKDKDNKLDLNEVGLLIDPMKDQELKELEINEILQHHDLNKDGKISIEEFKQTRADDQSVKKDDEVALDDFNFFDTNKDGFIDKEEIVQVYFDPAHESGAVNINEIKDNIFENQPITYEKWLEKALRIAVTSITDYGDILRYPEDFKLDIGKNVVLPSARSKVSEDDELDQEEVENVQKEEETSSDAEGKTETSEEL